MLFRSSNSTQSVTFGACLFVPSMGMHGFVTCSSTNMFVLLLCHFDALGNKYLQVLTNYSPIASVNVQEDYITF